MNTRSGEPFLPYATPGEEKRKRERRLLLDQRQEDALVPPKGILGKLSPYPLDTFLCLGAQRGPQVLDANGVPVVTECPQPTRYHPAVIVEFALGHWNGYFATGDPAHLHSFTAQVQWLVDHEQRLVEGVGGWPIPWPRPAYHAPGPWLSATVQGGALSVLVRAYRLTGDSRLLKLAGRVVRTFLLDILDGGVSAPVGEDGICFEDTAVYPAAHILSGFIVALIGVSEYVDLTGDPASAQVVRLAHAGLHSLFDEFDTGYWSRHDLLHRGLSTRAEHDRHVALVRALAHLLGCTRCRARAESWALYQRSRTRLVRHTLASAGARCRHTLRQAAGRLLFGEQRAAPPSDRARVCVPITAFPVAGGMRGVLAGIAEAMRDRWDMQYVTQHIGPQTDGLAIRRFGHPKWHPWQFPNVWLYAISGWLALVSVLRDAPSCQIILPQDGVFTGAFSAIAARMAGVRVVCMDHGNVTLPDSPAYRAELRVRLREKPWPSQLISRLRFPLYWPSLRLLARVAAHHTDHFLPAGDDVAEAYVCHYGVHPSRITRFPILVNLQRFAPRDEATQAYQRAALGIPQDAIVVTMVNRLAIEKGIDIALRGLSEALQRLPDDEGRRVRLIIAGDGPLRTQVAADLRRCGLEALCTLWGEATPAEVATLLGVSDIFLYTSTRGINPVSLLEAMAAGCAVIGSLQPRMVGKYLADGRGMAIPAGDAEAVATALVKLIGAPALREQMGQSAREFVATYHTAEMLRRALLRATFWASPIITSNTTEVEPKATSEGHLLSIDRAPGAAPRPHGGDATDPWSAY